MKRLKRIAAVLCAVMLIIGTIPGTYADNTLVADKLYTLGLIQGSDLGFETERTTTRTEALTMIVRLSGGEADTLSGTWSHPFNDVPSWANSYIGYAYEVGLTTGKSSTSFGGFDTVTSNDFLTFLLRLLGYSDSNGDFTWSDATAFAARLGISNTGYEQFTRGDAFDCIYRALMTPCKGTGDTLMTTLIAGGTVDISHANAVGLGSGSAMSAEDIYVKCLPAVFDVTTYRSQYSYERDQQLALSTGFFISPDGIAVMNHHCLENAQVTMCTLATGERYLIEKVIYYDEGTDIVVVKVSNTSVNGKYTSAFPYLQCDESSLTVGEAVYSIGNSLGLSSSFSSGIVSYTDRQLESFTCPVIQTTVGIAQGNSGGPLLNAQGKVVGVTSAVMTMATYISIVVPVSEFIDVNFAASGWSMYEFSRL